MTQRPLKREPGTASAAGAVAPEENRHEGMSDGRLLRSRYRAVTTLINAEIDDVGRADSDKFETIIREVESLHQLVRKPREQVADAEALLGITNSLVMSIKAHGNDGITASDFINSLVEGFGKQGGTSSSGRESERVSIGWREIGVAVSDIFKTCPGCHTMIGPMNTQLKLRKAVVRRGVKPTETARPEEVDDSVAKEKTDTDKNMATMFDILKKKRSVKLENLVLNRNSFAQTVENLFALSFLVKDGRAEMKVNQNGWHLVSPRNAPAASAVASKEVSYSHFVFRFDFNDWKLMIASVGVGEELMPDRNKANVPNDSQQDLMSKESEGPTTPIRKLSRNRGLVFQEETIVDDSFPESDHSQTRAPTSRIGKRKAR